MKRINLTKKVIISSLLVLFTVVIGGCSSILGSNQTTTDNQNQQSNFNRPQGRGGFQQTPEEIKAMLKPLINDGTLTEEKAQTVSDYLIKQAETRRKQFQDKQQENGQNPPAGFNQNPNGQQNPGFGGPPNGQQGGMRNGGQRPNMLGELVTQGTITQAQADKIMQVMFQGRGMNRPNNNTSN